MTDPSPDAFEIIYRMQRSDYVALNKALNRLTPRRAALSTSFILVGVLAGGLAGANGDFGSVLSLLNDLVNFRAPLGIYLLLILLIGLFTLGRPLIVGLQGAWFYRRISAAGKELHVSFSGDGIDLRTDTTQSHLAWRGIRKLITAKQHYFVTISQREGIILPKRAFKSVEEEQQLVQFIEAHIGGA